MIYKIITMGKQEITIESDEDLSSFLREANSGKKLVLTKHGIVNVASIDSIVIHKEKMMATREAMNLGKSREEAEKEQLETSPFAKLLANESKQLN